MHQTVRPQGHPGTPAVRVATRGAFALVVLLLPVLIAAQAIPDPPAGTTAGSAIPDDPGLLKRAIPANTTPPAFTTEVRVRINDDLGKWSDAVRAAVLSSHAARIGEPAEVELQTRPNFPLTLQLANAWEPMELWQLGFADDGDPWAPTAIPRTIELGNLALEDYVEPLRAELDRLGRVNALLGAAGPATQARTVTCFVPRADTPVSPTCDVPLQANAADAPPQLPINTSEPVRFAVGNRSTRPQHVVLLFVDSDKQVTPVPLAGNGLVAPGAWAQSDGDTWIRNRGAYWLVTLASERPIAFDPSRPDLALGEGVFATVSRHDLFAFLIVPIGGGNDVPDFRAPWMADFYSTVPYKPADFDADDAKPDDEKEFLRERSLIPGELAHRCGGTLIAPDLVVTAAHCVAKDNFAGERAALVLETRRIRLGSIALGRGGSTYAIDAMAVHGAYRPEKTLHDIALLRIKPDRDSRRHFGTPITLFARRGTTPAMQAGTPLTAYGWGYTGMVLPKANPLFNALGELQRNPGRLQVGELEAQGWDTCKALLGEDLGPRMLCAVSRRDQRTGQAPRDVFSCRGDSGGPLIQRVNGLDMLVGVASWSRGCGYQDYPSVYTDVARYAAWIDIARTRLRSGEVTRVNEQPAARAAAN